MASCPDTYWSKASLVDIIDIVDAKESLNFSKELFDYLVLLISTCTPS